MELMRIVSDVVEYFCFVWLKVLWVIFVVVRLRLVDGVMMIVFLLLVFVSSGRLGWNEWNSCVVLYVFVRIIWLIDGFVISCVFRLCEVRLISVSRLCGMLVVYSVLIIIVL